MSSLSRWPEMVRKHPLIKNISIYLLINAFASLFPFLILPFITRLVLPADYGVYAIFLVGINILMPIIGIGMETAIGRRFIDKDKIDFMSYISTALLLSAVLSLIAFTLLKYLGNSIEHIIPVPETWFWVWVLTAWSQNIISLVLVLNQMRNKPLEYGKWRISRAICLNALLIGTILLGFSSWTNLITVVLCTNIILALASIFWLSRHGFLFGKISSIHLSDILRYGGPLVPHMIGAAVVTATDRILLTNLISDSATGIYTVGYQAGLAMFLFGQSVTKAWTPWCYNKLEEGTADAFTSVVRVGYIILVIYILAGAALITVGWFVLPIIFGSTYETSIPVFAFIVAAFTAHGLWSLSSSYLYYSGDTILISFSSIGAAILNIGFSYVLISVNGIVGAAQGTLTAYAISFIIVTIIVIKKSPLTWSPSLAFNYTNRS